MPSWQCDVLASSEDPVWEASKNDRDISSSRMSSKKVNSYWPWSQWVKVAQSCLILCDPMDCSQPGSFVHRDSLGKDTGVGFHALLQEIFPTQGLNLGLLCCRWILYRLSHQGSPRTLEWIAISFSRRTYQSKDQTLVFWSADKFFTTELPGKPHIVLCS